MIKNIQSIEYLDYIEKKQKSILIKFIHARAFDKKDTSWAYKKQKGICPYCHKYFEKDEMHGDHIKPWSKGGATERENLQMLCSECNLKKSAYDT